MERVDYSRRRFLRTAAAGLSTFGLAPLSWPAATTTPNRPNVVVIVADDLGRMDIEPYNSDTFYETPHLSRLAKRGIKFLQAYGSNPVCSPTRHSTMTGQYPSRDDATNWFSGVREGRFRPAPLTSKMPRHHFTLAEAFHEGGYKTFFAGKWHLGEDEDLWPENRGFDINKGGWTAGSPSAHGGGGYFSPYNNPRLEDGPEGEYLTDRLAQETVRFIRAHRDEPFFAFLSLYSVHTPLQAPAELVEKYRRKAQEMGLADLPEDAIFGEEEQVWPVDDPRRVRHEQSHLIYAAMVESMDRAVGQVLDELDRCGLDDNTLVLFTSDDGGLATSEGHPTSNLPLRGGKGWLYEGGLRYPFIMAGPGVVERGVSTDTLVINTDFYPTLLEMTGLPLRPEQHLDGVSFAPALRGEDEIQRGPLFWHYPHYSNQGGFPGGAIREGAWKLIERYEDGQVQLYNVIEDIAEQHDRAADFPERVRTMRDTLHAWYRDVDAKFLRPLDDGPEPWRPEGQ